MKCKCGKEAIKGSMNIHGKGLYWYGCAECGFKVDAEFMSIAILKFYRRIWETPALQRERELQEKHGD